MKLRNKVLIVISLAWLVFLGLTYIGSKYFLLSSFLELEYNRANQDLSRIDQALDQNNYSLYTYTADWAHWTDLYEYIIGKNTEFVPGNINMTTAVTSHINLQTFWDKDKNLTLGSAIDTVNQKLIPFPKGIEKYIYPDSIVFDRQDVNKDLRGYIITENGIMLIAAVAITDGDMLLPPQGVAIFGRNLDKSLIDKIMETTKLKVKLFLPDAISADSKLSTIFSDLGKNKDGHFNKPINHDTLQGYTVIKDIFGKPIGMFQMTTPRSIYLTGASAIQYYLATFLFLGILFIGLILYLLRALIIQRLERLDSEVANIGEHHAIKERVDASGSDELSSVSIAINKMLDIIQASHDQLENKVEERTQELKEEITERKSVERELIIHKEHLVRLAHYDNLTSLPNRVFFNEILNKAIKHAKRNEKTIAVMFVDLDRFKNINDALGHHIGDKVLKEMATRFSSLIRAGDILARLGGDEFIILLNDIGNSKFVTPIAEKVIEAAAKPVKIEGHEFFISASIGVSIYPGDGDSLEDLQKNADMAMYKAKKAGGSTVVFYEPAMDTAAEHMKMEAALRRAIQNNEFVLYFQPQMTLQDGKIKHCEALIRWEDPELGMISPGQFIPLAEETGLIMQIGEWALHEACRLNKKWQEQGYDPISVAVNISPKQFRHQDVAQIVEDALKESDLDPQYLEVEITETAVMDNVDDAIAKLQSIKDMGVHISVDDFGTGYTSINYLRQYPVSVLKIDQTFIKGLPNDPNDEAITSAVISLGHNLGLNVVAEGVETVEQLKYLADHGCDLIQGYFLSRPLPEGKFLQQLTKEGETADSILDTTLHKS
jgi:diguanylate cyclase (GGDEF)-like protein